MKTKGEYRLALALLLLFGAGSASAHVTREEHIEELDRRVHVGEIQLLRDGGDPVLYARLTLAYIQRARLGGDWTDIDRAGAILAQGLQQDPEHGDLLWAATQLYAYQHRFAEVLAYGRRLQRRDPDDPRGWAAVGDAQLEMGEATAALASYGRMGELQRDFSALVRQARAQVSLGAKGEAARLLRGAIAAGDVGQRRWASGMLAQLQMQRGQLDQAASLLEDALLQDMDDDVALKHLGDVRALQGDDLGADGLYATAFGLRPDPSYALAWAPVKRRLGQPAIADTLEQIAERALRAHAVAGRVAFLRELAELYLRRGEQAGEALSLALADTALRRDTAGLATLAWAYQANGRPAEALVLAERAVSRPDASAAMYFRAGSIAVDLRRHTVAREWLAKALLMDKAQVEPFRAEAERLLALSSRR